MVNALRAGILNRLVESRANKTDFDKVIEVASLERGVLPIVCKTKELFGDI